MGPVIPAQLTCAYKPLEWLVVRAPLLPTHTGMRLLSDPAAALEDPRVRAALAVGATDLLAALERPSAGTARRDKAQRKMQRYVIRMATRPTPYGLFAGVALASFAGSTDIKLAAGDVRTRSRPDMAWLIDVVAGLEQREDVRDRLTYRANTAAHEVGGRLVVDTETSPAAGQPPGSFSVRATAAVRAVLEAARQPRRFADLAAVALAQPAATESKARRLLSELIDRQLLISELRPPLTCSDPAQHVLERLQGADAAADVARPLARLLDDLAAWDAQPITLKSAGYRALLDSAKAIHRPPTADLLQVDSALELEHRAISSRVGREAARAADLLMRLSPSAAGLSLQVYRNLFAARYGPEQEVPLLELLDPDIGLGALQTSWPPADAARAARRDGLLVTLAAQALRDRQPEIDLDDTLVGALQLRDPDTITFPTSIDLAVILLASGPPAIDTGDFELLVGANVGSQSAGRYLGRFADLLGNEATQALRDAVVQEDQRDLAPDEIAAELVYLPRRARSANVAVRPRLSHHEIVIGTSPGVADGAVIALDELVVGLRDDRLRLRCPRAGKYVRVRAGHMLNSMQAPAVVRFLEDIQREGVAQLSGFDWGPASRLPYLPRVRSGRVILAPARWRMDASVRDRDLPTNEPGPFAEALARWRAAWAVPPHIYLSAGDNRLLLDLDDPAQAEQLRHELRRIERGGPVLIQEPIPDSQSAWLAGPGGAHIAELVIPLVATAAPQAAERRTAGTAAGIAATAGRADRLRPPGSDWLYAKLYMPRLIENEFIAGPLASFAQFAVAAGLAHEWFFVRYADPDPHVRLRLRGAPEVLLCRLLPQLTAWALELLDDDRLLRFSFDTYEREVERYGGPQAMALAESVFAVDSATSATVLGEVLAGKVTLDSHVLAAISIDDFLAGLGLDADRRLAWYRETQSPRKEAGDAYRRYGAILRAALTGARTVIEHDRALEALQPILQTRRTALAPIAAALGDLAAAGSLDAKRHSLWASYLHLHCNRLFGSAISEPVLFGLLQRTHEGLVRAPTAGDLSRR